jgi:hypothetical protein
MAMHDDTTLPRRVLRLALVALLGSTAVAGTAVLHETDFETDPLLEGWGSTVPLTPEGNAWTLVDSFSPAHSIRAAEGFWYSPEIVTDPFEFYGVTFRATASAEGFFGPQSNVSFLYRTALWGENFALFRGAYADASPRILFSAPASGSAYLDDVTIESLDRAAALSRLDELLSQLKPYTFTAEPTRHAHLPLTTARLAAGQTVRVVMLGDSIVNDISHSYFELLVERLYPGARVEVVTSTRDSTGCWWYREIEPETAIPRVQTWVTDHAPQLVVIGGISHGNQGLAYEIDSCRDVIEQVRAILPDAEFLLLSEAAGANDPYQAPHLVEPFDPQGTDWRARLYQLAEEQQVEFHDVTLWWATYILHSGRADVWFKRDPVHMNYRGSLLAGRILEAYFAPTAPDADQDGIPDALDPCPHDPLNDVDGDEICAAQDPDDDDDFVADETDCAPENELDWSPPGEVSPCDVQGANCLRLGKDETGTLLQWSSSPPGGLLFWYDVLRGAHPGYLGVEAVCLESTDASDLAAHDPGTPPPNFGWYYLVRAWNSCGVGPAKEGLPPGEPVCFF